MGHGVNHDGPSNIIASTAVDDVAQNSPTAERDGYLIPDRDETGYKVREQPYGTKREVKVILMGAGASTLNFLKKAEEQMQNMNMTVYEKNHDVGGTWVSVTGKGDVPDGDIAECRASTRG